MIISNSSESCASESPDSITLRLRVGRARWRSGSGFGLFFRSDNNALRGNTATNTGNSSTGGVGFTPGLSSSNVLEGNTAFLQGCSAIWYLCAVDEI